MWIGIATDVEAKRVLEIVEATVVKEHFTTRDVAKRGRLEHSAEVGALLLIVAHWAANPFVEILRIAIRRDLGVARNTDSAELIVGEQRMRAVRAFRIEMTC